MLLKPMYTRLKKESPWKWRAQCEEAFCKIQNIDATKPLRLACDAYPFAVVAVISHAMEEKPLAYASHMLKTIMQK